MFVRNILFSILFFLASVNVSQAAFAQRNVDFVDIVEELMPKVVNISISQKVTAQKRASIPSFPPGSPFEKFFKHFYGELNPENNTEKTLYSLGSGFIISEDGYIVTNAHVIDGADQIEVKLHDETNVKAKLVGIDKKTDIALLKIDLNKKLEKVEFGDSNKAKVGEWVIAIGNPFGLGGSVSVGIISAIARDIEASGYVDYIQTDAAINRGNSGGPLFDKDGKLIGINTAIFSNSGGNIGIGFAIPIASVKPVIEQLKKQGHVTRGWLGVNIQLVTEEIANIIGLEKAYGAYVVDLTANGPAALGGVKKDDVIIEFNHQKIDNVRDLPRIVGNSKIGKIVPVKVLRYEDNAYRVKILKIQIGNFPSEDMLKDKQSVDEDVIPNITTVSGLKLVDLTDDIRSSYKVDPTIESGVLVIDFDEESTAELQGLEIGDVIIFANRRDVRDVGGFVEIIENAKSLNKNRILMRIKRGDSNFVIAFKIS